MPVKGLDQIKKMGLIAGNGRFPLLFAKAAASHGIEVVAIAIKKDTSRLINVFVPKVYWLTLKEYSSMFEIFKKEGIHHALMAGQVNPRNLFDENVGDEALRNLLRAIKDQRPDTLFGAVAGQLANHQIQLLDSTLFLEEYMPRKGVLGRHEPDSAMWEDIQFGFDMVKKLAGLDVGQTIVVKNKAIVAVEAIEGTDAAILRGGQLVRTGVVVVKVSKPDQDMRFDVPVVGSKTFKYLIKAKACCLAIEASKTLLLDRDQCVASADQNGIVLIAI